MGVMQVTGDAREPAIPHLKKPRCVAPESIASGEVDGEGAGFGAGLECEFEEADGAEGVLGGDGERRGAEDGVADVGVKLG